MTTVRLLDRSLPEPNTFITGDFTSILHPTIGDLAADSRSHEEFDAILLLQPTVEITNDNLFEFGMSNTLPTPSTSAGPSISVSPSQQRPQDPARNGDEFPRANTDLQHLSNRLLLQTYTLRLHPGSLLPSQHYRIELASGLPAEDYASYIQSRKFPTPLSRKWNADNLSRIQFVWMI
jgi:hypothetical protein